MKVHILTTCLNPELEASSLLVFRTIRTGFPTAEIKVYSNNLPPTTLAKLSALCESVGATIDLIGQSFSHDDWIEALINLQSEPFWIVDPDVVFFGSVEKFKCPMMGGRFEPQFEEEWTASTHMARLHTAVMYLDPVAIRCAIREWRSRHVPRIFPNAIASLVRQQFSCLNGRTLFYDSTAGLYHAFGGTPFTDEINSRFEHLHCGSYADIISQETESLRGLVDLHKRLCHDVESARGIRLEQDKYYKSRNGVNHAVESDKN